MTQLSASFSKASFVAQDQAEEVDLDDPDFWKKAIGLVEQAQPEEKEDEVSVSQAAFCSKATLVSLESLNIKQ